MAVAAGGEVGRHQHLSREITALQRVITGLVEQISPTLAALFGVGPDSAGQLLLTAGDNPDRLRSEASFAHLCAAAPIPTSSGRTDRHRLHRGGDRQANAALYRIVLTRLCWHQPTRDYMQRRTQQGLSKKDIIRCLKRYVARKVYTALTSTNTTQPPLDKHRSIAVGRIVRHEAAAGAPREPQIAPINDFPMLFNDVDATNQVMDAFADAFGANHVHVIDPKSGSEDFGCFAKAAGVPWVFWNFGGFDPALYPDGPDRPHIAVTAAAHRAAIHPSSCQPACNPP